MTALNRSHKILLSFVALGIVVTLVSAFWRNNGLLFLTLLAASAVLLLLSGNRRRDIVPFVAGALLGPIMEAVVIRTGAWQYAHPTAFGIPVWLPLLWGLTALSLVRISRWLALENVGSPTLRSRVRE